LGRWLKNKTSAHIKKQKKPEGDTNQKDLNIEKN
jgi:hypothetical protein